MDRQFAFCENSLGSLCLIYILIRNLLLRHKWWPVVVHKLICPSQFVEPYSRVNKQCTGHERVTATKTTITTATAYICHCQKGWVFISPVFGNGVLDLSMRFLNLKLDHKLLTISQKCEDEKRWTKIIERDELELNLLTKTLKLSTSQNIINQALTWKATY